MAEIHDSPHVQFIQDRLQLLLTPPKGRRFTTHILIFAAGIFCKSRASDDDNLDLLFANRKPEQRLGKVLFDKIKLKTSLMFTGGYIVGHSTNKLGDVDVKLYATMFMFFVCLLLQS